VGHRTLDGQDTIEIASADGHTTYFVDPGSYRPVELRTRGTDGGTALRFRTYETLDPGADASLLSLAAQHAGAPIDRAPPTTRPPTRVSSPTADPRPGATRDAAFAMLP
jgi:hypothetical protein